MQPSRMRRQRLPGGDSTRAFPRLSGVGDAREQPAQLDCGRQLAATLECGADRGGFRFGNDEHPASMVMRAVTGKPCISGADLGLIPPPTNRVASRAAFAGFKQSGCPMRSLLIALALLLAIGVFGALAIHYWPGWGPHVGL
jgi:hypothetical protein